VISLASPKSASFTDPLACTRIFAHFMSLQDQILSYITVQYIDIILHTFQINVENTVIGHSFARFLLN